MSVIGVVTTEGMSKAIAASENGDSGWKIYPEIFALSDVRGALSPSRTFADRNAVWYEGAVVKKRVIDDHSVEFSCPLPPNATIATRRIEEVYLYGKDHEGNTFLLCVGQPSSDLVYYPDGSITLRLVVTITNINTSELYAFSYVDSIDVDEHNEDVNAHERIVGALAEWITGLGKAVLKNGQIVRGGAIYLDKQETGAYIANLEAAAVFLNGVVKYVPPATPEDNLLIPADQDTYVGVWINTGATVEAGAGAALLNPTSDAVWGLQFDAREGEFYPIYLVIDGAVQEQGALLSSEAERIIRKIERYDYDANGHYVVRGLKPKLVYFSDFETQYLVEHGLAHIAGREVHAYFDLKPTFPNDPDLYLTEREAHVIEKNGDGSVSIEPFNEPLDSVLEVSAPIRSTLMRTKTSSSREQLPITAVLGLVQVYVGETDYMSEVTLDGDDLVWGTGAPAVGTTYFVVIDHTVKLEDVNQIHDSKTRTGFLIPATMTLDVLFPAGALFDQFRQERKDDPYAITVLDSDTYKIRVDYQWRIPRIDCIYMTPEGIVGRQKGVPSPFREPVPPKNPAGTLSLMKVYFDFKGDPVIRPDTTTKVDYYTINRMQGAIKDLYDLVALERLKNDVNSRTPAAKHGLFVDPMVDNNQRDIGLEQYEISLGSTDPSMLSSSVSIVPAFGEAFLPIDIEPDILNDSRTNTPYTLDYDIDVLVDNGRRVEQTRRTGDIAVNPYAAFERIPAEMRISPAVDIWTENRTNLSSGQSIDSRVVNHGVFGFRFRGGVSTELTGVSTNEVEFLRELTVQFKGDGFVPTETVSKVTFDGVELPVRNLDESAAPCVTNSDGIVEGLFTIPPNTFPSGRKLVEFEGDHGSVGGLDEPTTGNCSFTGRGTVSTSEWALALTGGFARFDPIAQTFTLNETQYVTGIDFWITQLGTERMVVQLRNTTVGIPDQTIAEVRVPNSSVNLEDWTRVTWSPVLCEAGVEYAFVVMSDDPQWRMAIAELGGVDQDGQIVSGQAYQIGTMLSSANATTWTPHQAEDTVFRLLTANFQPQQKISLGQRLLSDVSDLMVSGGALIPSQSTDLEVEFVTPTGEVIKTRENTSLPLDTRLSGLLTVNVNMKGNTNLSPLLFPEVLLLKGKQQDSAGYISRQWKCGIGSKITVTAEVLLPPTTSITPYLRQIGEAPEWQEATENVADRELIEATPTGDWYEYSWDFDNGGSGMATADTNLKLILTGSADARPRIRNLRAVATDFI